MVDDNAYRCKKFKIQNVSGIYRYGQRKLKYRLGTPSIHVYFRQIITIITIVIMIQRVVKTTEFDFVK